MPKKPIAGLSAESIAEVHAALLHMMAEVALEHTALRAGLEEVKRNKQAHAELLEAIAKIVSMADNPRHYAKHVIAAFQKYAIATGMPYSVADCLTDVTFAFDDVDRCLAHPLFPASKKNKPGNQDRRTTQLRRAAGFQAIKYLRSPERGSLSLRAALDELMRLTGLPNEHRGRIKKDYEIAASEGGAGGRINPTKIVPVHTDTELEKLAGFIAKSSLGQPLRGAGPKIRSKQAAPSK